MRRAENGSSSAVPVVEGAKVTELNDSSMRLERTSNGEAQGGMRAEPEQTVVPANGLGNRVASNSDGSNLVGRGGPAGENFRENDTVIENSMAAAAAQRRDLASLSLGEKLLQGWTLLQESCARCSTPLLRDVSGTLLCVTCTMHRDPDDIGGCKNGSTSGKQEQYAAGTSRSLNNDSARMRCGTSAVADQQTQLGGREEFVGGQANTSTMTRANLVHQGPQIQGQENSLAPVHLTDVVPAQTGQLRAQQFPNYRVDRRAYGIPRRHSLSGSPADRPLLEGAPASHDVPASSNTASNPIAASADLPFDGSAPNPLNVALELYETEQAVAAMLAPLRSRLNCARDVDSVRTACVAIQAAADAIAAVRRASSSVA
jgi:uncharacterized Zn finger protein (UPF0148 family)